MEPRQVPGWGVDRSRENRPGVPQETAPHPAPGAHWKEPEQQRPSVRLVKRGEALTSVFGTAQPARGVSGALRQAAYRTPDHMVRHWLLLMLADRVDVVESWATETATQRPLAATAVALAGVVVLAAALRR